MILCFSSNGSGTPGLAEVGEIVDSLTNEIDVIGRESKCGKLKPRRKHGISSWFQLIPFSCSRELFGK